MGYKRLQNTVTESKALMPVAATIAAAACYLTGLVEQELWMQLVCLAVSTILLLELNSANQLLRVNSQATAATYLLLVATAIFLFPKIENSIMQLCIVALYYMLFHCKLHDESPGWVFYGFFCLGLASMVFVQVLYYVPVIWVLMASCLRAFNAKTFWASIIGLATPYWLGGPFIIFFQGGDVVASHFRPLWEFLPLADFNGVGEHEWLAIGWTVTLTVIGVVHYLNSGYQDKIRTRLLHEIFITVDIVTLIFLILQPQHYELLLGIMIVNTSPLIAHYMTLTHTWLTNITFQIIVIITLAIIAYNVWMPSSNFLSNTAIQACSFLPL